MLNWCDLNCDHFIFSFHPQPSQNMLESSSGLIETDYSWTVNSACGVALATHRLQTEQPKALDINIPSDLPTPPALEQLCRVIQQYFTGGLKLQLWSSYLKYEDCSGMIEALAGSRWGPFLWLIYIFKFKNVIFEYLRVMRHCIRHNKNMVVLRTNWEQIFSHVIYFAFFNIHYNSQ